MITNYQETTVEYDLDKSRIIISGFPGFSTNLYILFNSIPQIKVNLNKATNRIFSNLSEDTYELDRYECSEEQKEILYEILSDIDICTDTNF